MSGGCGCGCKLWIQINMEWMFAVDVRCGCGYLWRWILLDALVLGALKPGAWSWLGACSLLVLFSDSGN